MELVKTKQEIKEIKLTVSRLEQAARDMFIYNITYHPHYLTLISPPT